MYLRLLLLLLPLMGEWQVAVADCGKACYNYTGTYYEPCRIKTIDGNNTGTETTGTGEDREVILVKCDEDMEFSGSRMWFELPDGVTDIIISKVSLSGSDRFSIGRLICSSESECYTITLTSDAEPSILIRLKVSVFKIQFLGIQIDFAKLVFSAVCDRKCAKMKMPANPGLMKRIVDGANADPHEFPFIVRMSVYYSTFKDDNNYANCNKKGWVSYEDTKSKCCNNSYLFRYRCGGSILNEDWILTAQHCVTKNDTETINNKDEVIYLVGVLVFAGDHNTTVNETTKETLHWVTTTNIKRAPGYNVGAFLNNDVAILKLTPKIELVEDCRYPICLPPSYMNKLPFLDGCAVQAAGWGLKLGGIAAVLLQKGDFSVVNNGVCNGIYAPTGKVITDKMICTDHNITITCSGDSGGPVFCKSWSKHFYQVGVISFGELLNDDPVVWNNAFPDVNARVTKFVAWIKGIVGAENLP